MINKKRTQEEKLKIIEALELVKSVTGYLPEESNQILSNYKKDQEYRKGYKSLKHLILKNRTAIASRQYNCPTCNSDNRDDSTELALTPEEEYEGTGQWYELRRCRIDDTLYYISNGY